MRFKIRRTLQRARFWSSYPIVLTAFAIRQHRENRKIIPIRWLTQPQIVKLDLEMYEADGRQELDTEFIQDFAKARDDLLSTIKKQMLFNLAIFIFLGSSYLGMGLGLSGFGLSINDQPGVAEALLLISSLVSAFTLMLQSNVYLMNAAVGHVIDRSMPEELRSLYRVRYLPHEYVGIYFPNNLPHLVRSAPTRWIGQLFAILLIIVALLLAGAYLLCNIWLLLHYLWFNPRFGVWSFALLGFLLALGGCSLLYLISTRIKLPFLDYSSNHELELLQQINENRYIARRHELYGKLVSDRKDLEERGYLKPMPRSPQKPDLKK